ncbi:MAG TPA: universal stress protein [Chloroflexota bacterium]|jgi:nucleotide-binding universal stress UspA family protein
MRAILVPLDGTAQSQRVLPCAEALARGTDGWLLLMEAAEGYAFYEEDARLARRTALAAAEQYLAELERSERGRGVAAARVLLEGPPVPAILAAAESSDADLIVMATHARSGLDRLVAGSVAEEVLRRSSVPLLLVPPGAGEPPPSEGTLRVLVPLDGSRLAEAALEAAAALAPPSRLELLLLRVAEPPDRVQSRRQPASQTIAAHMHAADRLRPLRAAGAVVTAEVRSGRDPAETIAAVARERSCHLIAMATHGRSGLARLLLGSVAAATLARASVPVLLVRPSDLAAPTPLPVTADATA